MEAALREGLRRGPGAAYSRGDKAYSWLAALFASRGPSAHFTGDPESDAASPPSPHSHLGRRFCSDDEHGPPSHAGHGAESQAPPGTASRRASCPGGHQSLVGLDDADAAAVAASERQGGLEHAVGAWAWAGDTALDWMRVADTLAEEYCVPVGCCEGAGGA
jgi:hypothetical protein